MNICYSEEAHLQNTRTVGRGGLQMWNFSLLPCRNGGERGGWKEGFLMLDPAVRAVDRWRPSSLIRSRGALFVLRHSFPAVQRGVAPGTASVLRGTPRSVVH